MITPREQIMKQYETAAVDSNKNSMLSSRNNHVAKSTANLIIKQQIDDNQYSSVKQPKAKTSFLELKESKFENISDTNSPQGSPN